MDLKSLMRHLLSRAVEGSESNKTGWMSMSDLGALVISNSSHYMPWTASPRHSGILLYGAPCLLLFGSLGNILSLMVMPRFARKLSTYLYLMVLAFVDLFVLYVGLLPRWIQSLLKKDVFSVSPIICKVGNFGGYFGSQFAVWLIVAVTFERFLSVQTPKKAARFCKLRNAGHGVIAMALSLGFLNAHFFWTVDIVEDDLTKSPCCRVSTSLSKILPWIDGLVYFAAPFTITSVLVSIMIYSISRRQSSRQVLCPSGVRFTVDDRRQPVSEKKKRLTLMLLSVSVTYLLTTLPMVVILLLNTIWQEATHEEMAYIGTASDVAELFMYANHAIHFILYFAIGKEFRKLFRRMICLKGTFGVLHFDPRTRTFSFHKHGRKDTPTSTIPLMERKYTPSSSTTAPLRDFL